MYTVSGGGNAKCVAKRVKEVQKTALDEPVNVLIVGVNIPIYALKDISFLTKCCRDTPRSGR